jgi:hypothetical protein
MLYKSPITDINDLELLKRKLSGTIGIAGRFGAGKTVFGLSNPWANDTPTIVIDSEGSAQQYRDVFNFEVIDLKPETSLNNLLLDIDRYKHRCVIILESIEILQDTLTTDIFATSNPNVVEKASTVVWGKVKTHLRRIIMALKSKCDILIITAHTRAMFDNGQITKLQEPKFMAPAWELTHLALLLERRSTSILPDAILDPTRGKSRFVENVNGILLPVLPPRIPEFSWEKLLYYLKNPADYSNLKQEEKVLSVAAYMNKLAAMAKMAKSNPIDSSQEI